MLLAPALVWFVASGSAQAAAPEDAAPSDGPWTLRSGQRVEIVVRPYDHVLSADPDRLEVTGQPPDRIAVVAGAVVGPTLVYVVEADGTVRPLSFEIEATAPGEDDDQASSAAQAWFKTSLFAFGTGGALQTVALHEDFGARGLTGPGSISSGFVNVALAPQPRYLGALVQHDDDAWRAALGRTSWNLADNVGFSVVDGAAFEWGHQRGLRLGGSLQRVASLSLSTPEPFGAEVSAVTPALGPFQGGVRLFGWSDPDVGVQAGGVLTTALHGEWLDARVQGFWSGRGGGASGVLDAHPGPFSAHLDAAVRSRGVYVPGQREVGQAAQARLQMGLNERAWGITAYVGGYAYELSEGESRRIGWLGAQADVRPSRELSLSAAWQAMPNEARTGGGAWTLGGEQLGTLGMAWGTHRVRILGHARLRLPIGDTGTLPYVDLLAQGRWVGADGWSGDLTAVTNLVLGAPGVRGDLRASVQRQSRIWHASAWAGLSVDAGGDAVLFQPTFGGLAEVRPHRRHAVGLSGWVGLPTGKAPTWQAEVHYTLYAGFLDDDGRRTSVRGGLRGVVFEDVDRDGERDPAELPAAGAQVTVDGSVVAVAGDDGRFVARKLEPGDRRVRAGGGGWVPEGSDRTATVRSFARSRLALPVRSTARVELHPYADKDGDGIRDPGEPAVAIAAIRVLGVDGSVVATTDQARDYTIVGLPSGAARAVVDVSDVPSGYVPAGPVAVDFAADPQATVVIDFPFHALHAAGGRVRIDRNGNGLADNGDPPAAGVIVRCDGQTTTTDADGRFLFRDLPVGTLSVEVARAFEAPQVVFTDEPNEVFDLDLAIADPHGDVVAPTPVPRPAVAPEVRGLRSASDRVPLAPGAQSTLPLFAAWSDGTWRDVAAEAAWTTSDPAIATVEAGRVVGMSEGRAEIVATWSGREVRVTVDVTPTPLAGLVMSQPAVKVAPGGTSRLSVRAILTDGTLEDVSERVDWTTSDPSVATVDADGTIHAVGPGSAEIGAALRGVQAFPARVEVR